MKLAAVAICSELDAKRYAEEWIKYHKAIGFDDFWIYLNNVSEESKSRLQSKFQENVHLVDWPGRVQQLNAYNDFIKQHSKDYDWCLAFDIDEFFAIGEFEDAKEAFSFYKDYYAVAFPWKLFGSNGIKRVENGNYSVINRFTRSQEGFNKHIKTAINLKRCREFMVDSDVHWINPHFVDVAMRAYFTIRSDLMKHVMGPWSEIDEYSAKNWTKPWIAHYATKSNEEFIERRSAVRADTNSPREDLNAFWTQHDRNEVENLDIVKTAQKFM